MPTELNRREWLAALGAALAPTRLAAQQQSSRGLSFEYVTDPEHLARMLPPPLEPASEPLVRAECMTWEPANIDLLHRPKASLARVLVRCKRGDVEGWLPIDIRAANDRDRLVLREKLHLPALAGAVELREQDGKVTAEVRDATRIPWRLRAQPTRETAAWSAAGPLFAFAAPLQPDWKGGLLGADPVDVFEVATGEGEREVRVCENPSIDWPDASAADLAAEFPVKEIRGCWLLEEAPAELRAHQVAETPAEPFEPWALLPYGRPISRERTWTPSGWPEQTTAARLSDLELERWSERKELILEPLEIVELDLMISRETHEALLPPPCRTAGRPMAKIVGLRIGGGDLSLQPFSEVWLLAFCIVDGRPGWFALSHLVSPGGDVVFGREALGYPSKLGDPEVVVSPVDFSLAASRFGREVLYADGGFQGFSTGTSLGQMPVVGLAASRDRQYGRLIHQMWTFQGRRNGVDPRTLRLELPAGRPDSSAVRNDPWFDLSPFRLAAVSVMDSAIMQRQPGEDVWELEDFEPYYRERCDGVLPWEPAPEELGQPTFLVSEGTSAGS